MVLLWRRAQEPVIVLAITAFAGVLAGSQRWAGLDTPDSSFYASLSLFGDEVTDRAPMPSYYSTRLGYIVPVRVLTTVLGPWPGFAVYRLALLLLLVAATYIALRRFTGIPTAAFLTAITSLSTVVLSYLGNTYLTGSVLAGTAVVIACALFDSKPAAVVSGLTLGWLAMVNPPGALLAGTLWLVLRLHQRSRPMQYLIAGASTIVAFGAFLLAGRIVFPRLDWLDTYLDANATMTLSNFASKDAVWLRDISLLVPVAVLAVVLIGWVTHRSLPAAQRALVISATSMGFMLVFSPMMGGIALEAPMYQAMLWPPAILALALVATAVLPARQWTASQLIAAVIGVVAVVAAGHANPSLSLAVGWLLVVVAVVAAVAASWRGMIGAILGLALVLSTAQLLQNSRGDLGLYYLSPYNWAFNANPISDRIHTAVNVQEWLLANTTREDQLLLWVQGDWVNGDRELYVVAGMQLWGENRATLEPQLTDVDVARLDQIRPTVIAMYGQTMPGVLAFWSSIPAQNRATAPECYDFAWTPNPASVFRVTEGHACLTRLTWTAG